MFFILLFLNWQWFTEAIHENPKSLKIIEISGGASNKNYLFQHEGKGYFVRCAPETSSLLGADIAIEYQVLKQLSGLACAPEVVYFNPEKRILVTEFMELEEEPVDLLDRETRLKVFSLLHKIEKLDLRISRDYTPYSSLCKLIDKLREYDDTLSPDFMESLPLLKKIDRQLAKLPQGTLCHRDLHHGNILRSKKGLVLIDWEYAVMSHPFCTLASMATVEEWDDATMRQCLQDYMEKPTEEDFHNLYLYRIMADSYWYVWTRLQRHLSTLDGYSYADWEVIFHDAALSRIRHLSSDHSCKARLRRSPAGR